MMKDIRGKMEKGKGKKGDGWDSPRSVCRILQGSTDYMME